MKGARRTARVGPALIVRTVRAFYDDQMTHHAAALTYYALMSLFPALLLAVSILGLVGQYPATYDAILGYLRDVVPPSALVPLDSSLRAALQHKGTAATTLAISVVVTLYGTTGALEAARRALNVVFDVEGGRRFVVRKAVDIARTVVLMALVLDEPRARVRRRQPGGGPARLPRASARPSRGSGTSCAGRRPSRSRCWCSRSSTT